MKPRAAVKKHYCAELRLSVSPLKGSTPELDQSGLDLGLDPVRNLYKKSLNLAERKEESSRIFSVGSSSEHGPRCQGGGGSGLQMCRRAGLPGSDPVSSAPKHRQAPATPPLIIDKICCFGAP